MELHNLKVWQQDEWIGTNMLVSLNNLNLDADTFDLSKNIININSVEIDHPLFAQYDYAGNEPDDTTTTPSSSLPVIPANGDSLQWNTDGWRIAVNNIQISDGGLAIEKQTERPAYTDRFDDQHIIISNINGTFKNFNFLKDTLKANIQLSCKEKGDFTIKNLSADFKFTPKIMEFNKFDLVTNRSHLTNYYSMRYNNFNE